MPLHLQEYDLQWEGWREMGIVQPSDPAGYLVNHTVSGIWEVYLFRCRPDDSRGLIYRLKEATYRELQLISRGIWPDIARLQPVKELKPGESFDVRINPYPNVFQLSKIRFIHR